MAPLDLATGDVYGRCGHGAMASASCAMTSSALLVLDRDGLGRDGFGHDGFGHDGLGRNGFGSATGLAAMGSAATELNNQPFGTGTANRKQAGGDT